VSVGARALAALAALLAAAQAALLAAGALRPADRVFDQPFSEDGFYALTIARNVAAGRGVTIDGELWTNGFQPLFTFMEAAMFRLADGDVVTGGRLVIVLAAAVHLAGALLVGLVARDARLRPEGRSLRFWLGAALYLVAAKNFGDFYTGLETGLQLASIAALWRAAQLGLFGTRAGALGFGALIGVALLARIDSGFLAVALALWILLRHWPEAGIGALSRPALMALGAAAVSAPWWLYNRLVFGAFVPSSGTAQQDWALDPERVREALWALRMVLMPWIFVGPDESMATDLARVGALVAAAFVLLRMRRARPTEIAAPSTRRTIGFAGCLALAWVALAAFYTASFFASWFYFRYFAPLSLLVFVAAPVALAELAARGERAALAAAVVLVAAWGAGVGAPLAAMRGALGPPTHWGQVALVRGFVPDSEPVAAGQTGTLGFFRAGTVNLDGKVNREALAWQGRMPAYLDRRGVRWFVDSPWYVERMLGADPEAAGWAAVARTHDDWFRLYRKAE
jgi:hypothetical protein